MDNNINKRQKEEIERDYFDDETVSDKITYKKFKDINFEIINYKDLQSIALSLELSKNGKKLDLYNRIEKKLVQESLKHDELYQDANSFNKSKPQLLIKDVDKHEYNFWEIFRNKFLFKSIFSNFTNKESYEDFNSIETIDGLFNSFEFLKDKIKCKSHFIKNQKDFLYLFGQYKKNHHSKIEIIELYNQLFKLYTTNITNLELDNVQEWIPKLIGTNNVVALDFYIKFFNVEEGELIQAADRAYKVEDIPVKNYPIYYKFLKMNHYLKSKNCLSNNPKPAFLEIHKFNYKDMKFKQLFKLLKFIKELFYPKEIKNEKIKQSYDYLINLNGFSKKQLNSTIDEIIISSIENNNESGLREILHQFSKIIYKIHQIYNESIEGSQKIEKSHQYYIYFKDIAKIKLYEEHSKIFSMGWFDLLFCYTYRNDKKERISLINKYKFHRFHNEPYSDFFSNALKRVIDTNDIDIIRAAFYGEPNIQFSVISVLNLVNSTLVLDFLFKKYRDIFYKDFNGNWQCFSSMEILEYYENQLSSINRKFRFPSYDYRLSNGLFMDILNRAIKKPDLYDFHDFDHLIFSFHLNQACSQYQNQEQLIEFFLNFQYKPICLASYLSFDIKTGVIKFNKKIIKWLFSMLSKEFILQALGMLDGIADDEDGDGKIIIQIYKNNDDKISLKSFKTVQEYKDFNNNQSPITSTLYIELSFQEILIYLLHCGRLEEIYQIYKFYPKKSFNYNQANKSWLSLGYKKSHLFYYSSNQLLKFIKYLFDNKVHQVDIPVTQILYHSLCIAAKNNYFSIFKYIKVFHSNVLKVKNIFDPKSKNNYFESQFLYGIIFEAGYSYNIDLAYLLCDFINLPLSEIKIIKSKISDLCKFLFKI